MAKTAGTPKSAASTPNPKKTPGGIQKNKTPKFKNTPTGKVAFINGKTPNKHQKTPKGSPLVESNGVSKTPNSNAKSPKEGKKSVPTTPSTKQELAPEVEIASKKGVTPKKGGTPKKGITPKKEASVKKPVAEKKSAQKVKPEVKENPKKKKKLNLDADKSDDSINKEIFEKEESDDDLDDDSEEDLPDSLDKSSDEDSEDSDKPKENKGVKMFKGLVEAGASDNEDSDESDEDAVMDSSNSLLDMESASDDDDDDDEEESDDSSDEDKVLKTKKAKLDSSKSTNDDENDSDDDESEDESTIGLDALLGDSLKDDEDDEDFDEEDEDEDDDDEDECLSSDDEEIPKKDAKKAKVESDDSRMEAEDDEDFEDESDDEGSEVDESPKKKEKVENKKEVPKKELDESTESNLSPEERTERDKRTIFIGNIPKDATKMKVKKMFRKFGLIETIRLRGIVPENPKLPFKAAAITGKTHPKVTSVWMYITYKDEDSAKKALSMNGKKLDENILRVDSAYHDQEFDQKKGVFLGNVAFECCENTLWNHFGQCGPIESVRLVKDRRTGLNKGIGYINFKSADAVALALELNGSKIKNRPLRVVPLKSDAKKKPRINKGRKRSLSSSDTSQSPKKLKNIEGDGVAIATHNSQNAEFRKQKKNKKSKTHSQGETNKVKEESVSPQKKEKVKFQGEKADKKKKQKSNKLVKQKKIMAEKLTAKPKIQKTD